MRILIVEDELLVAECLKEIIEQEGHEVVAIVSSFEKAQEALSLKPEFVVLDINLEAEKNGIAIGEVLQSNRIPFAYLTANNEVQTVKKAAHTQPQSYLTKPFTSIDIVAMLEIAVHQAVGRPCINLKGRHGTTAVPLDSIYYVKSSGAYIEVVCQDKVWTQRMSLQNFIDQCPTGEFVRIHRSYVINRSKIQSKTANSVRINGVSIPWSKDRRDQLTTI